jgi:hypothetical protein
MAAPTFEDQPIIADRESGAVRCDTRRGQSHRLWLTRLKIIKLRLNKGLARLTSYRGRFPGGGGVKG